MKRKIALLCVLALLAGVLVGCQAKPSAEDIQRKEVDGAIHRLEPMLARFYMVGASASVADVQEETEELSKAWREVAELSEGLEGIDTEAASAAHDELVKTVGELPDDAAQGQAMRAAIPRLKTFTEAVEEMHEASGLEELDE